MKIFEKIRSIKTSDELRHLIDMDFCNRFSTCKLCPLNSTNRPHRSCYDDDDDFCCSGLVLNFLMSDIEEENKNEE